MLFSKIRPLFSCAAGVLLMDRKIDPMMIGITDLLTSIQNGIYDLGKAKCSPFSKRVPSICLKLNFLWKKAARLCGFCVVFATETMPKTKQKLPRDTIFFTYRIQQGNKSWFGILGANKKGHIEKFKDKNYKNVNFLQKLFTKDLTIKHIDTFPTLPTLRAGTNSKSELETSAFPQICLFKKRLDTFHLLFKMKVLNIDNFRVRKTKPVWKRALQIGLFFSQIQGLKLLDFSPFCD